MTWKSAIKCLFLFTPLIVFNGFQVYVTATYWRKWKVWKLNKPKVVAGISCLCLCLLLSLTLSPFLSLSSILSLPHPLGVYQVSVVFFASSCCSPMIMSWGRYGKQFVLCYFCNSSGFHLIKSVECCASQL